MNKKLGNMVAMKDEELDAVVGGLEAVDATYHTFKYNVGDSIQVYQIRHKMFNWSIFDVTYTTTVIDRKLGDDGLEYYQVSDAKTWYAEDNIEPYGGYERPCGRAHDCEWNDGPSYY